MKLSYIIFQTPQDLAEAFAADLADKIKKAADGKEYLNIALSGGNTPKILFTVLAEKYSQSLDWCYVHFFWVDERCVPPEDPESNFGMTKQFLLDKIKIPRKNIHRMRGENDPGREAERYSEEILKYVCKGKYLPVFDIMILGIGDDGHTASIFTGNTELLSSEKICGTSVHPVSGQIRITLTGKVINNSKEIFFLVTGEKKSDIVYKIISKSSDTVTFPAANIFSVHGKTIWLLDEESGRFIK